MITYGNIYIITKDFANAVSFYKKLFQSDVVAQNKTRYAIFEINGLGLSILNGKFDQEHPSEVIHVEKYNALYDDTEKIINSDNCGKVVINLTTDDLQKEYERISDLQIGTDLSEIRYLNARMPYWYFLLKDIDGNTIEITGKYDGKI